MHHCAKHFERPTARKHVRVRLLISEAQWRSPHCMDIFSILVSSVDAGSEFDEAERTACVVINVVRKGVSFCRWRDVFKWYVYWATQLTCDCDVLILHRRDQKAAESSLKHALMFSESPTGTYSC
jgi:hypothetical protein